MLGNRKLILDTFCEVYDELKPWADYEFWDFAARPIVPNAIYVVGRAQFNLNLERIKQIVRDQQAVIIFSNPAEGSETLKWQMIRAEVDQYVIDGQMLAIGGGDIEPSYRHLQYDSFLPKIYDYEENVKACECTDEIFQKVNKPYKFLFLNGRARPHRKFLLESFRVSGLLDQALWTNLDTFAGTYQDLQLWHNGENLMLRSIPVKYLDSKYEVPRYHHNLERPPTASFAKFDLFEVTKPVKTNEWGEIYLHPAPYIDTYFSLITETVFNYPYSFRTEKIWKPIAIGHPWIAVSNHGYYRDIHDLGFKTFGSLIDESFDQISNDVDRITRIRSVVEDLCSSEDNLKSFLLAAEPICRYNKEHLAQQRLQVRKEFPDRFFNFLRDNSVID